MQRKSGDSDLESAFRVMFLRLQSQAMSLKQFGNQSPLKTAKEKTPIRPCLGGLAIQIRRDPSWNSVHFFLFVEIFFEGSPRF